MSDWELVDDQKKSAPESEWELVSSSPSSMPQSRSDESLGMAALKAIPRVGEDLYRGGMSFLKSAPGYFEKAKTEVPALFDPQSSLRMNPFHADMQGLAGGLEAINQIRQLPKGIANYLSNRLNLLPQSASQFVSNISPKDESQRIQEFFGDPKYRGEALLRGAARNAFNIMGAKEVGSLLNPLNLTAKSIAKDVLKEEGRQVRAHSNAYNEIWDKAEKSGFNEVPVDQNRLHNNLLTISKYKTPREFKSLANMINEPSLQNAQKAQSDMGIIHRKLEEKSRSGSLTSEERAVYDAARDAEKHIEENMFKNKVGDLNEPLQHQYSELTKSYRENVVPYKYNRDIQAFKNREMLADELVNSLSRGEFAAKKGGAHPALKIRNMLKPTNLAGLGAAGVSGWLLNEMFGHSPTSE